MHAVWSRVFSSGRSATEGGPLESPRPVTGGSSIHRQTRNECLFSALFVPRRLAGRASSSTSEGLLVGIVTVFANIIPAYRSLHHRNTVFHSRRTPTQNDFLTFPYLSPL